MEIVPRFQQDPENITRVFAGGGTAKGVSRAATRLPFAAVARLEKPNTPLSVNHQSQYPAATVPWNLTADPPLETAANAVMQAMAEMPFPDPVRTPFAGAMTGFPPTPASQ